MKTSMWFASPQSASGFCRNARRFVSGVNIAAICLPLLASAQPPVYIARDLGTLGGRYTVATALNDSGEVVGYAETASQEQHAVVYRNGVLSELGLPGSQSRADDINSDGIIVANYYDPSADSHYEWHAVTYNEGTFTEIESGAGDWAYGINSYGDVVGYTTPAGYNTRAFLYSGGQVQDLGTLGGPNSLALSINDAGEIVGHSDIAGVYAYHAFLYASGSMTDLGTLGGLRSVAVDINSSGHVVGTADVSNGQYRPFLYREGAMLELSDGGNAAAINDAGEIVGGLLIYIDGTGYYLSDYVIGPQQFYDLADINSAGQIVGHAGFLDTATSTWHTRAYLLSPATTDDLFGGLISETGRLSPGKSLYNKAMLAQTYYLAGDTVGSCVVLHDIESEVEAQTAKKVAAEKAGVLKEYLDVLSSMLDCD